MLTEFLAATAWPMKTQLPYSAFHLILTAAGCVPAVFSAFKCSGSGHSREERILFGCGLCLAVWELYKQCFLYQIVFGRHYNWWYFPFQLCSIPMYLCLLYPFFPRFRKIFSVFLQDFGLLGGIMALIIPDGLFHPYWSLTIHGFFWHFMLVFLGIYCGRKNLCRTNPASFLQTLLLYFLCCAIACILNTAIHCSKGPYAYADLFYINCFFPSEQPLFRQISLSLGNIWGHLAYILASCLGARLIHLAWAIRQTKT